MKKLTLTLGLSLFALPACDDDGEKPSLTAPKARSQAVVAEAVQNAGAKPAATPVQNAAAASGVKATRPRELCEGQLKAPGKKLSELKLAAKTAAGQPALPEALELAEGRWTWLNFWAAWCVPCREEIPRLKRWDAELGKEGRFRLTFISLDDDERQLTQFLAEQPGNGLKRSYWIEEGDRREEWFAAVAMDPDPELPAHILLDPQGLARCVINGAVEDSDFPVLRKIVAGR